MIWDEREQRQRDYRFVFGSEEGERVLKDLMERCFCFGSAAVKGDPHATYFNEGMRAVILKILQMLETNPEQYRKLYRESIDDYIQRQSEDNYG